MISVQYNRNLRCRTVLIHPWLFIIFAWLVQSAVQPAVAENHPDAGALFDKRHIRGNEITIRELRALHRQQPDDPSTRYYFASVLLENSNDLKTIAKALTLLDGLEKIPVPPAPPWLAMWAMARQVDAEARLQALTARSWAALGKESSSADPNFQAFLKDRFTSIDSTQLKIRGESVAKAIFTGDEVRADLHELVDKLRARWAYVNEKEAQTGHSLDDLLAVAVAEVQPQMVPAEVDELLRRFVGTLDDGHTSIVMSTNQPFGALPFRAIDTVDGAVVGATAAGGEALKLGDRLLEVDGRNVKDIIAEEGAMYPVSTEGARRVHGVEKISVAHSSAKTGPVRIERDGTEQVIVCPLTNKELPWGFNQQHQDWISAKLLTPNIGYLQVRTWMPEKWVENRDRSEWRTLDHHRYNQIDAALKPLRNAKDIIIDVRGNGGGRDQLCCYLGGYFLSDRPVKPYVLRYRAERQADGSLPPATGDDGFYNPKSLPAEYPSIGGRPWKARLWVLVDERSFSATDVFLDLLTSQLSPDRIQTIGRPSQGGIGGPAPVGTLHNTGASLTASTCRAHSLDGHLLEGHPARIDVPVQWTRADVMAGRDPDLETALKLIGEQK